MPRFGKERLRLEPAKGVLCRWKRQERKRTLALLRSRLSKKSTACVDGGASSPARCRGSNFQFELWQFCLQGKNAESCGFCASCHPLQFPLKSFGFPGAGNCKEAIFALGNGISRRKNQTPFPTRRSPGTIYVREGCGPLALSRGWTGDIRTAKSPRGLRPLALSLGILQTAIYGFQPSAGNDFCERTLALSHSPKFLTD